ncbi:MAG: DUF4157 domain-containing protein [Gammaproteobacteria bacterium]|nr:DUF4157 domain-containing protein [Gammaproteobacteria bacterium]
MKTGLKKSQKQQGRGPASRAGRAVTQRAGQPDHRSANARQSRLIRDIDNSASMTLQRQQLERSVNPLLQRQEEEELLQGKFDNLQRQPEEEEELMQGKFVAVQRQGSEEEELMQGRFDGLQRAPDDEEELMQGRFDGLQRQSLKEEEEPLQGKSEQALQREQQAVAATNKTGMPDNLKQGVESLSDQDLSAVRVHYDSPKPAQFNAFAYAQGNDIHLGSGQEKHLPHEAWHTVQQREGRVKPTMELKGENINDDAELEHEADVMGAKALQYRKR